jgi:hypothetical protein
MSSKILFTVLFVLTGMGLMAQNLDKAEDLFKANKIPEAKAEIDKVLALDKNKKNSEAWYYKLRIYNAVAATPALSAQYPEARFEALAALKRYTEVDEKKMALLVLEQYRSVNDIYHGFFQVGADDYNGSKYAEALTNFRGAIATSEFMNSKGWYTFKVDTTAILYAGISAEKAGYKDTAAIYYGKLADSGIVKIPGSDMVLIDKWLVNHYYTNKDEANMNKYLALGQKAFPDDPYWETFQLDYLREKGNKDALFAQYERVTAEFPKNAVYFYSYGVELYQYASDTSTGKRPENADSLVARAQRNLNKALELQPDYPQASLVSGQILYNQGVDIQLLIKTVKGKLPEDIKKRTDLRAAANKKFDEAIPYFEKVDQDLGSKGKLKQEDKTTLRNAYDLLTTIYEQKKIQDKLDLWQGKYNDVDKAH